VRSYAYVLPSHSQEDTKKKAPENTQNKARVKTQKKVK
jgi:hypothetical protein